MTLFLKSQVRARRDLGDSSGLVPHFMEEETKTPKRQGPAFLDLRKGPWVCEEVLDKLHPVWKPGLTCIYCRYFGRGA